MVGRQFSLGVPGKEETLIINGAGAPFRYRSVIITTLVTGRGRVTNLGRDSRGSER